MSNSLQVEGLFKLYSFNSNSLIHIKWLFFFFFLSIITANRFQKPGTKKSAKWTAEPGPASSELHHSAAVYNHQHEQEDSHRLQHLQWQVSAEWGQVAGQPSLHAVLSFAKIRGVFSILWVLQGWLLGACETPFHTWRAVSFWPVLHHLPSTAPSHVPGPLLPVTCRVVPGHRPGCTRMYVHVA